MPADYKLKVAGYLTAIINEKLDDYKSTINILQIALCILSAQAVIVPALSQTVLNLSLKAFSSKDTLTRNTAISVLRRMHSLLFAALNNSEETFKMCYDQLEELVAISGEKYKTMNYKGMGIDLLAIIFVENDAVLGANKKIRDMLGKSLLPLLLSYMKNPATPYPLLIRVTRLSVQLMLCFESFYQLLVPILSWVNSPLCWLRYLALEAFLALLDSSRQIVELHTFINMETSSTMLKDILTAMIILTRKPPDKMGEDKRISIIRSTKSTLDVMEAVPVEPPKISRPSFSWLICETLTGFIGSIEELFEHEEIRLCEAPASPFTTRQIERVIDPLQYTWKPMYELLDYLLSEFNDELSIKKILRNMQSLVSITGSAKLVLATHRIIKGISSLALPLKLSTLLLNSTS